MCLPRFKFVKKILNSFNSVFQLDTLRENCGIIRKQKIPEGSELANMVANDAKVAKLTAKTVANLALPPSSH
ncbi:hypothetical protein TNCV_35421 [Trichonephila clavipes]|nr:hypothetical protein TNCV_35421 [Trichonephila clavipes]